MKKEEIIPFKLNSESVPLLRTYWIGVLQGAWKEMGIQYGQRTAKDIRKNFDGTWKSILGKKVSSRHIWPKGKTEEEKGRYALAYVKKTD